MKSFLGPAAVITIAIIAFAIASTHHAPTEPIPTGVELMPPRPDTPTPSHPDLIASPDTAPAQETITDATPAPSALPTTSPPTTLHSATAPAKKPKKPAGPPKPKPPLDPNNPQDFGRIALGFVGTDPDADAAWLDAINNPDIDPDARRELIEDLNTDGFPDTKHLTPDDLPMIENRLALIEQEGPNAMDDINLRAYAEAYKDLLNMEQKVLNQ